MRTAAAILAGRAARWATRLRGGGSAVPGRVALALDPRLLGRAVERLRFGVVFVSGSNGKSTTTQMLARILREHGLSVFSNPTGGNLPQGVASALLADLPLSGRLDADIAVLEVDEAYGTGLADHLHPHSVLIVNIQVDQLNRFHEPDRVARMLETLAARATERFIYNGDDRNLRGIAERLTTGAELSRFAVAPALLAEGPAWLARGDNPSLAEAAEAGEAAVLVAGFDGSSAQLEIGGETVPIALPARGLHYAVDAAAAAATARALLADRFSTGLLQSALQNMATVYGRGEVIDVAGEEVEIIMMKNPPSLQVNLDYLPRHPQQVFVAVDEGTPDPSWIYATDLSRIDHVDVLTGSKSWQLATRFAYDGIEVGEVVVDLEPALRRFLALPRPSTGRKTMIVNYEQMMSIRRVLGHLELEGTR